ncbi:beta strand repeat-containing protein [Rugamonas apoptosis]|uniref:Ig-like domain-containing protein n=1 Tax=Rugamonas apoptosis TaxID=2758570 RepID=A0A7W2F5Q0_9BURK|nr:Ig-like domain-containing protein [Rugamonas apoptosis]MBA5685552.1 Ig-like domain-containing protein [Rugamonas apoptosis]
MKKFTGWLALLACSTLLAACGGGGGSPGTNGNGVAPSKAAKVVLIASAATMDSSGIDGTEVTLTAIVTDANGNALSGETVNFAADSGSVSNTVRQTNSSGTVVEKLNTKGNSTPRVITVTASAGNATSNKILVTVVAATPTLVLTTDSGVLQSAGASGNEVNLVALVKDANNSVMPGVKVDLAADSGSLTLTNRITDANGKVTEKLSTGGDPTSRTITVTARTPGAKDVTAVVNVAGNKLVINNSSTVKVGASTDVTVKLVDSAGNALVGRAVTFTSGANALTVKGGGSALTDTAGTLRLSYSAMTAGADTIVVKAMGETATSSITVSSANFNVAAVDAGGNTITSAYTNTCQIVAIHYDVNGVPQSGAVALSASRGSIYSDPGCSSPLTTPLTLANGNATGYVSALSPGVGTLTANAGGVTVQGTLEFVAPLTAGAVITVQADPAVVGANQPGSTVQQTTLRAIVRDGTAANNLVKNAQVAFSIVTDPSGGSLTQPSVVTTASDGSASVSYIAGTSDTKLDGVTIKAQLQGASNASALATLTVAKKSLFIGAGTGAFIGTPNTATYQLDYAVFVTDAAGNAVPGVNITGSVRPRNYYKGQLYFLGIQGPWGISTDVDKIPTACLNEDTNGNGILESGEDINGNGRLDPGITITVTSSGTTDANGQALVSLIYPRDRANWLDVDLTIRGQVSGTEARYVGYVKLPGLNTDYSSISTTPPGRFSPYGTVRTGDTYNGVLVANGCAIPN